MNFLLDTHTVIWFITDDKLLPAKIKNLIENKSNRCFVSIASLWEIGLKYSIGKLELKAKLDDVFQIIVDSGFEFLPIDIQHILTSSSLDFIHRDPFDRLIIAQAQYEKLIVISKDKVFKQYDVDLEWSK